VKKTLFLLVILKGENIVDKELNNNNPEELSECKIINLPKINDQRGNLTFIEGNKHIPFEIKRAYYLYDVPGGETRGGHAHKHLRQFLIAMSGSFDVILDDGFSKKKFHMNRAYYGLYIPTMIWRELENFSSGSVCLVLASEYYEEEDYIRDYKEFRDIINNQHQ
jgi:dTDP-4-dehydrorhamnose 3,5-epimerase-like enzyme